MKKWRKLINTFFFSFFPTSFISPIPKKWGDWRTWGATRERGQLLVLIFFFNVCKRFYHIFHLPPPDMSGFHLHMKNMPFKNSMGLKFHLNFSPPSSPPPWAFSEHNINSNGILQKGKIKSPLPQTITRPEQTADRVKEEREIKTPKII